MSQSDSLLRLSAQVRSLPPGTAEKVRLIVSEVFGGGWEGFQRYICEDSSSHEWRFQGALGFGGKLHLNAGRLWVSCYSEDETPILKAAMAHVNSELTKALRDSIPLCEMCGGAGRVDLLNGWHGPPGVERHNWHPCPDCDGTGHAG